LADSVDVSLTFYINTGHNEYSDKPTRASLFLCGLM
jgi:hypothetical protein